MGAEQCQPVKFVAGIDLGTTYSGYAFSTAEQYKKNKLDITHNPNWHHGSSFKAPTSILLQLNGDFVSFGIEAEKQYERLLLEKKNDMNYKFFRRFKMELYDKKIHENTKIKDIQGKEHRAIDVFIKSVIFLRDHCLQKLKDQGHTPTDDEVKWCLSVPAIWSDEAKFFMRKVCEQSGIPRRRLQIVLEPEVASLYCQTWYSEEHKSSQNLFQPGTKCLVIDMGGGTVDICGHEIQEKGMFRQICKASGNDCGGVAVDKAFMRVLENILGHDRYNEFKNVNTKPYMTILKNFETEKRNISEATCQITIDLPILSLNKISRDGDFEQMVRASDYKDIELVDETMIIGKSMIDSLYSDALDKLISTVEGVLQNKDCQDINILLHVGGFSESAIVRAAIKNAFPKMTSIIPSNPSLAILNGCVIYGHQPDVVTSRVTRFAYGRKIKPLFNSRVHEEAKKVQIDSSSRCDGVFELLVRTDTAVPVSKTISKSYHTVAKNQNKIHVALYKSPNNETKYVDEVECFKIGECWIDVPNPSNQRRVVDVDFVFGETEIFVKATDRTTNRISTETFNLE